MLFPAGFYILKEEHFPQKGIFVMAKLRKMLGDMDPPVCVGLMKQIETQSKATLVSWAAAYAKENYLPLYEKRYPDDSRLGGILGKCEEYAAGKLKAAELKPYLKTGRELAATVEDPIAQAAARACAASAATASTPSNAFGFLLYGAAAVAYDQFGLTASAAVYDEAAEKELFKALSSLKEASVEEEPKPVKIRWNC